jgi:hypothetical protein
VGTIERGDLDDPRASALAGREEVLARGCLILAHAWVLATVLDAACV